MDDEKAKRREELVSRYRGLIEKLRARDMDTTLLAKGPGYELFKKVHPDLDYIDQRIREEEEFYERAIKKQLPNQ